MPDQEFVRLLKQTRDFLSFHQALGIKEYPRLPALAAFLREDAAAVSNSPPQKPPAAPSSRPQSLAASAPPGATPPIATLAEIREQAAACRQCSLHEQRRSLIWGEGSPTSGLLVVVDPAAPEGEAAERPLTGDGDELLTKMLGAIQLKREAVYVTSLLKCPSSGQPDPQELRTCLPLLYREIAAASPRIICAMGPLAAQLLLASRQPLFKLRGRFHSFQDRLLMSTFHPAYLLKHPEMKKPAWHDLQAIQKRLAQP